jgi:hypothetical protein
MRLRTRSLRLIISCSVALALFASAAMEASPPAQNGVSSRLTRNFRAAVAESTAELPGGILERVQLLAREAISKDPGAPRVSESFVDVFVQRVDTTTGQSTHFFSSVEVALAPNELRISPTLRSARLVADIPVTEFFTGQSYVLSANLQWQASDTTQAMTFTEFSRNPSLISFTTNADRLRLNATVSGTLTYPLRTVSDFTGVLADQEISTRTFLPRPNQGPAQLTKSTVTLEGSSLFASATYVAEVDACVVALVNVRAEIPTDDAPNADVSVTEVDNCAATVVFEAAGNIVLSPDIFLIGPDLSSAQLNATAEIDGHLVALDLTWTGGQELSSQTLRAETITPTETVTQITQGVFSIATVAGSVTIPTHVLPVPEGSSGFLGSQFAGTTTTQQ